jgi:serine protease Do
LLGLLLAPSAQAQLNSETKKLFEELAPLMEPSVKAKFEKALQTDQCAIDFTAEEFIRFRSHPKNPFAGLDKIDPYAEPGLIRLEFNVPSVRDRLTKPGERQFVKQLAVFQPLTGPASAFTVQVFGDQQWVAMGTIVSANGFIVTKASEVSEKSTLVCRLTNADGSTRDVPAKLMRIDDRNDIGLLKVNEQGLTPAPLSDADIVPGSFVVTPNGDGKPLVMGVVSTVKRSLIGSNQAYLGVRPINGESGVELDEVTKGGAAERAGLIRGDIVVQIADVKIESVTDLVNAVRLHQPGDVVAIRFRRGDVDQQLDVALAGRNTASSRGAEEETLSQFGAIPSRRRDDFPLVFQHDSPLTPETCGGPLLDIEGNVIGVNIARAGRVASLAIGSAEIRVIADQLMRENVASNE